MPQVPEILPRGVLRWLRKRPARVEATHDGWSSLTPQADPSHYPSQAASSHCLSPDAETFRTGPGRAWQYWPGLKAGHFDVPVVCIAVRCASFGLALEIIYTQAFPNGSTI